MAASTNDQDDMITGINITPMVDVMLVLLVIFMIAAPSLYQGAIELELPAASSGDSAEKITLKFSLLNDGKILLDKREITQADVPEIIKKSLAIDPRTDALVAADRMLMHGTVMGFVDQLKLGGIQKFSVAVEGPESQSKK
jgi:biopolymer transport protein ExbD